MKEAEEAKKNKRFARNLAIFQAHGERAVVWRPSKVQRMHEVDDKGDVLVKKKKGRKLLPLCESAFISCTKYNRTTKQGIKMTRVATSCTKSLGIVVRLRNSRRRCNACLSRRVTVCEQNISAYIHFWCDCGVWEHTILEACMCA